MIRAGLIEREEAVKEAEARLRRQHDYRYVLQYFGVSRELHHTLVANVNYLANEVEQLRAQMDHRGESVAIMEKQLVELEVSEECSAPRHFSRQRSSLPCSKGCQDTHV